MLNRSSLRTATLITAGVCTGGTLSTGVGQDAAKPPEVKKPLWETSANVGIALTRGNSENFLATAGINTQRKWTRDEIIAYFMGPGRDALGALGIVYGGQQFLTQPIDQGFNRLAWLFPYLVAATGVVAIGFAALKWSRHGANEPSQADAAAPADPALDATPARVGRNRFKN